MSNVHNMLSHFSAAKILKRSLVFEKVQHNYVQSDLTADMLASREPSATNLVEDIWITIFVCIGEIVPSLSDVLYRVLACHCML